MPRSLPIAIVLAAACALLPSAAQAADLPVTNNHDAGPGSLRDAVAGANAGDTVVIQAGVETITLSGEIPVTKDLTIRGAGASRTLINADRKGRAFCARTPACPNDPSAAAQPSLSVSDLAITGGSVGGDTVTKGGGAILAERGDLTLTRVKLYNNQAGFFGVLDGTNDGGGAVYSDGGRVTIADSTLGPNNRMFGVLGMKSQNGGGAVFALGGSVSITNSHIDGNSVSLDLAPGGPLNGGGGVAALGGDVTATDSTINGNSTTVTGSGGDDNGGGGLYATSGEVTLVRTQVDDNALSVTDAGALLDGGGGIYANTTKLSLSRSSVSGNTAGLALGNNPRKSGGGGIFTVSESPVSITESTLAGNVLALSAAAGARDLGGGAMWVSAPWTLSRSTVGPNNAASLDLGGAGTFSGGGGVLALDSSGTITDSTLAQNAVRVRGGTATDGGGALLTDLGHTSATNATFAGNSADSPGGAILASPGDVSLTNTIIAANSAPAGANCAARGGGALVAEGRHDLESADTCGLGPADLKNTNPLLGPLAANGGPTQTLALPAGSPAIDEADSNVCSATDQRGVTRPKGVGCDIGAYEFVPPDDATPTNPGAPGAPAEAAPGAPSPGDAPGPTASDGGSAATTAPFAGVQLKRTVLVATGRRASVALLCPVGQCKGRVVLRRSRVTLGSAAFSIRAGKTANVRLRLTAAASRLLARKPSVRASADVTATSNGQTKGTSAQVSIKQRRRK